MPILRQSIALLAMLISLGTGTVPAVAAGHGGAGGHWSGGHGWGGHGWAGHYGGHPGWRHGGAGYVGFIGGPYLYGDSDWGWTTPLYDEGFGPAAPYPEDYPAYVSAPGEGHYCATPSRICELPPGGRIGATCSCILANGRAYGRIHE